MRRTPPYIRWHVAVWCTAPVIGLLSGVFFFFLVMKNRDGFLQAAAIYVFFTLFSACVVWLIYRRALTICRQATSKNGCVCTHCRFDLSGLGERGCCPECGNQYNVEQLREMWSSTETRLLRNRIGL